MTERWADVREALDEAQVIAFDGCHKIYLALDDSEADWFRTSGYEVVQEVDDPDEALATLKQWYDESCFLRFVQSVRTADGNRNDGFTNLIPQGAEEEDN